MSPDTQPKQATPTAAALAKAQTILLSVDWCYCRNDMVHRVCNTHRYIAAALDAFAEERIEEATDGDRTFARLAQVERERDDIAHESLATITGRQRAEERVLVLELALRELAICPLCSARRGDDHRDYCPLVKAAAPTEDAHDAN